MIVLLFFVCAAWAADNTQLPEQVLAAKTIAVISHVGRVPGASNVARESKLKAEAEKELRQENYFDVLSDANEADLVLLVLSGEKTAWSPSVFVPAVLRPQLWETSEVLGVLLRGKGWSVVPLWIGERSEARDVISLLHKELKKVGKARIEQPSKVEESEQHQSGKTESANRDNNVPSQVLTAKTIALLYFFPDRARGSSSSDPPTSRPSAGGLSVQESLRKWRRFELVETPAQADLVVIIYRDWWDFDWVGAVTATRDEDEGRQAMLVFLNGQHPDWSSMPAWMEQAHDFEMSKGSYVQPDLVKLFRKDVEKAERAVRSK